MRSEREVQVERIGWSFVISGSMESACGYTTIIHQTVRGDSSQLSSTHNS